MKKLLLLLATSATGLASNAQYARQAFNVMPVTATSAISHQAFASSGRHSTNRTTATCFATEDFGTGSATSLPTGWTAGIISGPGAWHWTETASATAFSGEMGAMRSTTASNGWMIFNSDSLGGICGCATAGYLQSPAYNCSAHTTVRLNFEDYFRSYYDSCFVWVSTDPAFGTYQSFPVTLNNDLTLNASTTNPASAHINITSAAAGHAAVYLRFVYDGYPGGSFAWMIDDVCISELDANDVGISGSLVTLPDNPSLKSSLFNTPLVFVDSIHPVTFLTNYGTDAETGVPLTAQIFEAGASVFSASETYASLPVGAIDSQVTFAAYKPASVGNYFCAYHATVAGDADATNNIDTTFFNVTDTIWSENLGPIVGAQAIHGTSPARSDFIGALFNVPPASAGGTVSGFGVAFAPSSVPTTGSATVSVQLYRIQATSSAWTYVGTSVARAITATDISTSSSTVYAYFPIDITTPAGVTPFILQAGYTYGAVVQINGVTTDLFALVTATPFATGSLVWWPGLADTSDNDGATNFGPSLVTADEVALPLVQLYFGPVPALAVQNVIRENSIGNAYPNPSNATVNIPFTMSQDELVTISVCDVMGQVIKSQEVYAVSGKLMTATFITNDLPPGVYMYTITTLNGKTSARMCVINRGQ